MEVLAAQHSQLRTIVPFRIRARRECVLLMYFLAGLSGISQAVGGHSGLVYVLTTVLLATAASSWALIDSRLSGRQMLRIKQEMFFFTWPLATLIYLIGTRKWRGMGLWLLNVFGLYATLNFAFSLTRTLQYWICG